MMLRSTCKYRAEAQLHTRITLLHACSDAPVHTILSTQSALPQREREGETERERERESESGLRDGDVKHVTSTWHLTCDLHQANNLQLGLFVQMKGLKERDLTSVDFVLSVLKPRLIGTGSALQHLSGC